MQREFRINIIPVVVTVAISLSGAFAQQPAGKCDSIRHPGRLTDRHRYRVKSIEGQAVYGEISEKGELTSASAVCIALFDQDNNRLVANVVTESGGQFRFSDVAPGKYILTISLRPLHEIAIPLEIGERQGARAFRRWGLLLHLRSREDRKRSYVTPITQPALREELVKMLREDQAIRDEWIKSGYDHPNKAIAARMAVIDSHSTSRLKEIVKKYGWPGPDLVAADGADAAFMLLQHSPDLAFQRAMLPLVRRSYKSGGLSAWNYALLLDRVLVREGKPQVYGMQVETWEGKEPVTAPIADEFNVDKRRARIGLPPLREYLEGLKRQYFPQP